jgi:hypothetical protein
MSIPGRSAVYSVIQKDGLNFVSLYFKISVLLTQYCAGDKIRKNEMGGACSTYGGGERFVQGVGGEA